MIRRQVQLTDKQDAALRRLARRRRVSVAAVVREAVDRISRDDDAAWRRALAVVGKYRSSGGNVAEEHDRYLAEIYRR